MTFAPRCHRAPEPIVAVVQQGEALAYFPLAASALACSPLVAWAEEYSLSLVSGP
jgi:hypothetical protein